MLNHTKLETYRTELGIDQLIENMMTTSQKITATRRDLAELNRRVKDREANITDIEIPFLSEVSQNGKNADQRKIMFHKLCNSDTVWTNAKRELDDAIFHRNMVQADLDGMASRFSAQRYSTNLITAILNACSD